MSDAIFFHIIDGELTSAGVLGGLFHAFRIEDAKVKEVVRYLVMGGLAGNFITPGILALGGPALNFLAPRVLEILVVIPSFSLAFCVGMLGRPIGYAIEIAFTNWTEKEKEND